MKFTKYATIAYRDLGRNRRRTGFTLLAIALGLALIILMSGFIEGVSDNALRDNIRISTGHLQIRAAGYQEEKASLLWGDLLRDPDHLVTEAKGLPQVEAASAVVWAGGLVSTIQESSTVLVTGIDPTSSVHAPIQEAMIRGNFLEENSRGEILLGRRLAEELQLNVGDRVSVAVGSDGGIPDEGIFTILGIFDTGFPGHDESKIFMTLDQTQSFTRAGNRASAIIIMLHDDRDASVVASTLSDPGLELLTWEDLNSVLLDTMEVGIAFYYIMYGIIILVVAVVIANTLLMSVFERTKEIGILAALGMKRREIMGMFLLESSILALMGIIIGILLGSVAVFYVSRNGLYIGDASASAVEGVAFGSTMYARYQPDMVVILSIWMLSMIVLVSIYPAWFAAKREPVEALHAN